MNNIIGTWTLFKRETRRFMKVWMQTILAPVVSNLLFLTVFGLSLSKAVELQDGVTYIQFIVPGLIMMGITTNSFQSPSSSLVIMKYQGLINDLMSIPLKTSEILLAFISSAIYRGLIVGFITYLTALFFTDFAYTSISVIIASSILMAGFFAFAGFIIGIWADEFDRTAFILNFILMPLIFLGGVFYSVKTLSPLFATISAYNPMVYMASLLRYGFTGVIEYPIALSMSILLIGNLILGTTSYLLLRSGWKLKT